MSAFLGEISGHDEVREQLRRLYVSGRIPNGLLLFGEAGRGRRTMALAFARVLICGDADGNVDPTSRTARSLAAGAHPDLEIVVRDGDKRQIGIDRIRALKQEFSLTPADAVRRVAVVVDADRLTDEAGNALLKLLEEPPPSSHLLLTARDRDAMMATLVSRCRCLRVPPLPEAEVQAFLCRRGVEAALARRCAALSEGCPGLALALASQEDLEEQVLSPAFRMLAAAGRPFGVAQEVAAAARQAGKGLEAARERLRLLLRVVAWAMRAGLRAAAGARNGASALELLPKDVCAALERQEVPALEAGLVQVLEALADIDRNVSPDLVLDALVPALADR